MIFLYSESLGNCYYKKKNTLMKNIPILKSISIIKDSRTLIFHILQTPKSDKSFIKHEICLWASLALPALGRQLLCQPLLLPSVGVWRWISGRLGSSVKAPTVRAIGVWVGRGNATGQRGGGRARGVQLLRGLGRARGQQWRGLEVSPILSAAYPRDPPVQPGPRKKAKVRCGPDSLQEL